MHRAPPVHPVRCDVRVVKCDTPTHLPAFAYLSAKTAKPKLHYAADTRCTIKQFAFVPAGVPAGSRAEFLEGHRKTGVTSHLITCYHHPWVSQPRQGRRRLATGVAVAPPVVDEAGGELVGPRGLVATPRGDDEERGRIERTHGLRHCEHRLDVDDGVVPRVHAEPRHGDRLGLRRACRVVVLGVGIAVQSADGRRLELPQRGGPRQLPPVDPSQMLELGAPASRGEMRAVPREELGLLGARRRQVDQPPIDTGLEAAHVVGEAERGRDGHRRAYGRATALRCEMLEQDGAAWVVSGIGVGLGMGG
eukprot:scaffold3703_cov56-Phaeocystis_antarctica.AAC.7